MWYSINMKQNNIVILLIFIFTIGLFASCSKPKYKSRNGGKRVTSIKASGYKR